MDCLGTYFTHVQSVSEWTASVHTLHMSQPNVTRVQSATDWTAWVHPSHMSKPNVTRVQGATVRWVCAENFARGRAPLQCGVVNSFAIQMQSFGLTPRFSLDLPRQGRGPRLSRAARKWCQRMRSKWGLRRRSLLDAEPLGREEVEDKARGVLF